MPWDRTTINSQVLAVHAAFLNFDQIVYFGGDQHDPRLAEAHDVNATYLFDCRTGEVTKIGSPAFDTFCCGHSLTTHGTLVVGGGTFAFDHVVDGLHHEHFPGLRDTAVIRFEPAGYAWKSVAEMNPGVAQEEDTRHTGGRWYPTLLTLANGDVLALSGHPGKGDREHTNFIPEVFVPTPTPRGAWYLLGSYTNATERTLFAKHETTYYPRAHLLPTGDVFFASPTVEGKTVTLTVGRNPWSGTFHPVCRFSPSASGAYGAFSETSVLLPLRHEDGYRPRVLLVGADQAWVIDLKDWKPGATPEDRLAWRPTAARTLVPLRRRLNGNVVLLPTGEVLLIGGVAGVPQPGGGLLPLDSTAVQQPEIYNPGNGKWKTLTSAPEKAAVPRNYHSVALLVRDGRVWTAGSDHNAARGIGEAELRIEIYEPWYQRRRKRPEILAAPDRWVTGEEFVVQTTQASDIRRVVLVRCGSCTHAFNPDQRHISLKFRHTEGNRLLVTAPPNGNISPSGMYFLYTINRQGLPSEGLTLYINSTPQTEDEREWDALYAN